MGKLIGLTGQTGAGKSTVANIMRENGYYIIDGDLVARRVTEKGSAVLTALCERFGSDILCADGSLNRAVLASRAFADRKSTEALNAITHPAIIALSLAEAESAFKAGYEYAVFDAAGLLESSIVEHCICVISVIAPPSVRLERIMLRDGISKEAAERRMSAQKDEEYYTAHSDFVIDNSQPGLCEEKVRAAFAFVEQL